MTNKPQWQKRIEEMEEQLKEWIYNMCEGHDKTINTDFQHDAAIGEVIMPYIAEEMQKQREELIEVVVDSCFHYLPESEHSQMLVSHLQALKQKNHD